MELFQSIWHDIRLRQNLDIYITVAVAIIVAILGIIGVANVAIIFSAVLATLALVSISLLQTRRDNDDIRAKISNAEDMELQLKQLISTIATFLGEYKEDTSFTHRGLDDINHKFGLTVRFIQDHPKVGSGELYRKARKIVERAEKEILVLYYKSAQDEQKRQVIDGLRSETYRLEHEKYVQAFLDKFEQHKNDKYFYKRIIQFQDGITVPFTEQHVGKTWFEHTKAVLEILRDYPEAGYIKKAPLFLDQTVVVVDEKHIIWGVDAVDPEYDVRYTNGALFFDDPHQEFVHYIRSFILRVDSHAVLVRKVPE